MNAYIAQHELRILQEKIMALNMAEDVMHKQAKEESQEFLKDHAATLKVMREELTELKSALIERMRSTELID